MGKEGLVAPDLQTQDWQTLFLTEGGKAANKHGLYAKAEAPNQHSGMASRKESRTSDRLRQLPLYEHILAADVVNFVDSTFSERQKRLHLSARQMEQAKRGLLDKGLIKQVWVGKVLLLAPVEQLYFLLGMESPYRRNNWDIHSFLVFLAAKLIEPHPLVKYVKLEVPLDDSASSTIDMVAYRKDGNRWAYEVVHRSITNIASLAARLIGKNYTLLIFLCTEYKQKQRVRTIIRSCGFDADFLSTIRYQIFSVLIRQRKQMVLKEL